MELKALKLYIFTTTLLLLSVLKAPAATEYAHFVHYSTNDGMASNRILYIEPDPEGHLWIATDFGETVSTEKNSSITKATALYQIHRQRQTGSLRPELFSARIRPENRLVYQ